jgi:hypothetical protein
MRLELPIDRHGQSHDPSESHDAKGGMTPRQPAMAWVGIALVLLGAVIFLAFRHFGFSWLHTVATGSFGRWLSSLVGTTWSEPSSHFLQTLSVGMDRLAVAIMAGGGGLAVMGWLRRLPLDRHATGVGRATATVCGLLFLAASIGIAFGVLRAFPTSADESIYLFQAQCLAQGHAAVSMPPESDFFAATHLGMRDDKVAGRFPPGWPLLMTVFLSFGVSAWIVAPLISIVGLIFLYSYASEKHDPRVAWVAVVGIAVSPFFLFNAASLFSHAACFLALAIMFWASNRLMNRDKAGYALIVGAAVGLAVLVRPFTGLLIATALLLTMLARRSLRRPLVALGLIVAGGLPALTGLLMYNAAVTGDAMNMPTNWYDADEALGWIKGHSPARAAKLVVIHVASLAVWVSPLFVALYVGVLGWRVRHRRWGDLDLWLGVLLACGYAFYWSNSGNRFGPRFYFEAYPFAAIAMAGHCFGPAGQGSWQNVLRRIWWASCIASVVLVPVHSWWEGQVAHERMDLERRVEAQDVHDAIVFVVDGTGVTRPMPIGDLVRNDPGFDGDVLFAMDKGEANRRLMAAYPDREYYRYSRRPDRVRGVLERLGD